jgi:copper chaperone NosL
MSNQTFKRSLSIVMAGVAAFLLLASLRLPLWQMRLEAPQYRDEEALKIAVFPNRYGGDMREISVLNQYIGVHVPPRLPQFGWLPYLLAGGAALGVAASLLSARLRSSALGLACAVLAAGLVAATVQAKSQMHDIGHKRDQRTVLAGMRDFTPPFLGTSKIAQFTVTSSFGLGAWLIGAAMALQVGAAWISRKRFIAPVPSSSTPKPFCNKSIETRQIAYQI